MHLQRLRISNFRSIEEVDIEFDKLVNVIIGPNAVGKTTILEAIRLAKAVLAPRTPSEANQTLMSLGITSPHMPQRMFHKALTNDPSRPTIVRASFKVEQEEITTLHGIIPQLGPILAQQMIGLNFANPGQTMAYFDSAHGRAALDQANVLLSQALTEINSSKKIELNLTLDFKHASISGEFPIHQSLFAALEHRLLPTQTLFSYFPADRAMPIGEQPVQLGLADTNQQLESYNSQPQIKYSRLKHTIFSSIIGGSDGREYLTKQFNLIFEKILKGRSLGEIGVNELGMLSIPIVDNDSGVQFDIDGLSSGEKGVILNFLLIARTIAPNGLILLDEPELHLNPAVCRDLLQFLVDEYAVGQNVQAIICSHSAEILAGALEKEQCSLFHLRGGKQLSKVRQQDQGEIRDALRRLGSSESESLLYKGTVSVEGIHDVEILQNGFDHVLRRYRLKQRGGRGQVEKDILELQKAETRGDEVGEHFFIFDNDDRPTSLKASKRVKILQLDRYCIENYLLDAEILTDLTREGDFSDSPVNTVTEMRNIMKQLALSQLNEVAARLTFKKLGLETVGFDMSALQKSEPNLIGSGLEAQIKAIEVNLKSLIDRGFTSEFCWQFEAATATLRPIWEERWIEVIPPALRGDRFRPFS